MLADVVLAEEVLAEEVVVGVDDALDDVPVVVVPLDVVGVLVDVVVGVLVDVVVGAGCCAVDVTGARVVLVVRCLMAALRVTVAAALCLW